MKRVLLVIALFGIGPGSLLGLLPRVGSCARPLLAQQVQECRRLEQEILASTVRLQLHGTLEVDEGYGYQRINGTISHATVVGGRYLLTHNHFGIRLSQAQLYDEFGLAGFSGISVYRLDGEPLLDRAPLSSFSVVVEEDETLLLDFGLVDGRGFFAAAGLTSAPLAAADNLRLRPGLEVAQVDWDGQGETVVVWTSIAASGSSPRQSPLRLDHYIELGASGGGIFLDGQHIGNSWSRTTQRIPDSGELVGQFSSAVLNSAAIAQAAARLTSSS